MARIVSIKGCSSFANDIFKHWLRMLSLAIILGVVGVVLGDSPAPCCFGNQWQGIMYQLGANLAPGSVNPQLQAGYLLMDYDYTNKKMLIESHIEDPATLVAGNVTVLEDFNEHKRYIVYPGGCTLELIPPVPMQSPCIPANFTYGDSYMVGGGASTFMVNIFSGNLPLGLRASLHVTADGGCYPISQSVSGDTGKAKVLTTYQFGNLNKGASKANDFVVPTTCTKTPGPVGKRRELVETMIHQLRVFS